MRPKAVVVWSAVCIALVVASGGYAVVLTLPSEGVERQGVVVMYADPETKASPSPLGQPALGFRRPDASEIVLNAQPRRLHSTFIVALSGAGGCRSEYGNDGPLQKLGAGALRPSIVARPGFEPVTAYAVATKVHDVSLVCTMTSGATTAAFSVRRFALAGSGRYFDVKSDDGCVSYRTHRLCPVPTYRVELDAIPDAGNLTTDGGTEIPGSPRARLLVESSSLLHVRWKNEADDHRREFLLFLLAGVFALGLATGLEAIKACLESDTENVVRGEPAETSRAEPDATRLGLKRAQCPSPPTPRSSSSAPDPPA
ncbi:MAG TPA: hypothetical protein VGC72_10760 [Candidatus Elarobacter sp.]